MLLMRADTLRRQMGGGWALEIETFLGPVKWHRAVRTAGTYLPYMQIRFHKKRRRAGGQIEGKKIQGL
jgi:hypothetical protein